MTIPQEPFDAATADLRKGVNLVEASAGTGKTFAIAMLALRFVTEFDFLLTNILVVTFTRAATEELKDRIRARLASARDLLVQQTETGKQNDDALAAWRAGLADRGISESLAHQRLERALLDMDLAPVFTIHGFCQRMLQEQALESGQLFDFVLTTDLTSQRNQVVHDYWRRTVYPLSPLHCALITSDFKTPADLFKSVEGAEKRAARIEPQTGTIEEALARFDYSLRLLADWWQAGADSLRTRLEEALAQDKFRKELRNNFSDWWREVDDFLGGKTTQLPDNIDFLSSPGITELLNGNKFRTSGGQSGEAKKQAFIATLRLPEQELADLRQARNTVTLAFRLGLIRELSTGLARTLRRQNLLSFDDLIAQLAQSLTSHQGPELQRIIGERYPVALIDEFQDTDDTQYSIFSTLFASQGRLSVAGAKDGTGATASQGRRSHYLYLIGDPKQAIYTFRGADIYSYFKAREEADIHLNLARNYRSHPALVEAINRLFLLREDADGQGRPSAARAMDGERAAFATARLPYFPVLPAKSADDGQLLDNGQRLAAMVYCHLDADPDSRGGRWSSNRATERIVAYVVAETARLLQPQGRDAPVSRAPAQAQPASRIVLTAADEPSRPLAARDIAILVRNHRQADQFQAALVRAGIPAVTASQQSVFHTDECHHLFLLIQALNSPGDATLLKTALTSPWFGMNGMELFTLWQNPAQVDQWLSRFHDYHQLWLERGFLTMMTRLLAEEMILLNLARQPLAERRISNIHHLLELIQTAATEAAMGPGKTLQWLQATKEETRSKEDTELRLESDEEAVRIVTMHSAKGLEYPVAFCPFLWQRGNYIQTVKGRVICHDEKKALVMDLGSPDFEARRQQALREELAEELRLAYVALTRARCRCYTFWAEVKGSGKNRDSRDSALAWLLALEQDTPFADRIPSLQATDGSAVCELLAAGCDEPVTMIGREMDAAENLAPLLFTGRNLHTDWLLHSYSSLAVANQPDNQSRWSDRSDSPDLSQAGTVDLLPDLPKGAQMGNVVHGLLEQVSFATLAIGTGYEEILRQQCAWFGVDVNPGGLAALLQNVVQTPLPVADVGTPFCLADLKQAETIREMPFYYRLQATAKDGLIPREPGMAGAATAKDGQMPREPGMAGAASTTEQINAILAGSRTVTPITPKTLQGYLTGFVDLICRYQGKYYIMDYKSNWLGNHLQDYGPESLEQAMRDHNYGLQYWLYTLVLHRYLQSCVEGYNYLTHFGGVMYLFVRGMEPSLRGSGVYFDLPDFTTLELLSHCLGPSCAGRSSSIPGASDTGAGKRSEAKTPAMPCVPGTREGAENG